MLESATFGDDVFDEDPTVHALQARLAELTGKEAALWTLSGTMGNQVCMRTHLKQPPQSVLLDHRAHIYVWESGALPALSQASVTPVKPRNGRHLTLDDVKENLIPEENCAYMHVIHYTRFNTGYLTDDFSFCNRQPDHFPPTRVVALENTLHGTVLPYAHAKEISDYVRSFPVPADQTPIAMHLDGARLFDAVAAEQVSLQDYCACFDSISLCLSKGLGAPMGTVIVGSHRFIARARWMRKMLGGGTRQAGVMAAAAMAAMDSAIPQIPRVHALARETARRLEGLGYGFAAPVQTNMILLDLQGCGIPPLALTRYCQEAGLHVWKGGARLVFHYLISQEAVEKLVGAMERLMKDKRAGVDLGEVVKADGYTN